MRKNEHRVAGLIACAAVVAVGCSGGATGKGGSTSTRKTEARSVRRKARRPSGGGEISAAVRQLMDAPPFQVWQAEDRLIEIGPSVAPYVRGALRSERGEVRAAAVRILGEVLGANAARDLVPLLEDEVLDVRYHTICVLREVTGYDFGYLHVDEPERRAEAVARWRAWLASYRGRRRTR